MSAASHPPSRIWAGLSLAAFGLGAWPSGQWYVSRTVDRSDEPLGLLSLAVALAFLGWRWRELRLRPMVLLLGAALLGICHLLPGFPPMVEAGLALLVLTAGIHIPSGRTGLAALLGLSLPIVASLDFYAGYPLRLAAAWIAEHLLWISTVAVERAGVILLYRDQIIGVDPPCAGIHMLWASLFTAAVLATKLELRPLRTAALLLGSVILVVLGNGLRSAVLFFPESKIVTWPGWTHEGVGLLLHGVVLLAILSMASRLAPRQPSPRPRPARAPRAPWSRRTRLAGLGLLLAAAPLLTHYVIAATTPPVKGQVPTSDPIDYRWPATWDGVPLIPLPLTPQEQTFSRDFPGKIARFQCGSQELVLRLTTTATRRLHSSADCLRAAGYRLSEEPIFKDRDGRLWGSATLRRDSTPYRMRERIYSLQEEEGPSHTDVSAWYWTALTQPQQGPWLAVTLLEPQALPE